MLCRDGADRYALLERLGSELPQCSEVAFRFETVRPCEHQPPVLLLPEEPDAGADEARRDTTDLGRRIGLIERRSERLSNQVEHRWAGHLSAAVVAGREGAYHERGMIRGELGGEPLGFRECRPGTE